MVTPCFDPAELSHLLVTSTETLLYQLINQGTDQNPAGLIGMLTMLTAVRLPTASYF